MKVMRSTDVYRSGTRAGLRSLLLFPRARTAPVRVRRQVGSFATDAVSRLDDVNRLRGDVREVEPVVFQR
jgi:hypothetical protein